MGTNRDITRLPGHVVFVLNPVIPFLILIGNLRPDIYKGASSTGYGLFCVSFIPLESQIGDP